MVRCYEFCRNILGLRQIVVEGRSPERKKEVQTNWEEIYKSKNANTRRVGKLKGLGESKRKLKIYVNAENEKKALRKGLT